LKRAVLILVFTVLNLAASTILNLNVKEYKNRLDLIINFDLPFEGKIEKGKDTDRIVIHLSDAEILSPWQKKLDNPVVYQIDVLPSTNNGVDIVFYVTHPLKLSAYRPRNDGGYSLILSLKIPPEALEKRGIKWLDTLLWIVLILAVLVGGLLLFKLWQKYTKPTKTKKIVVEHPQKNEFSIKFEKRLDGKNKIALISFKGIDYLVLTGANNVLLGKYKEGEILTQEDFENVIQTQNFEEAIKEQTQQEEDEFFTTIEEYKRKASGNL